MVSKSKDSEFILSTKSKNVYTLFFYSYESPKKSTFLFDFPDLLGIHRNPKYPQKKSFVQKHFWISCMGSKVPFWTREWNSKLFWPKDFFWGIMKVPCTTNIHNLFQGPTNPGFRSVKVQIETFLKRDSRDFKNSFYSEFVWFPSKPGKQN